MADENDSSSGDHSVILSNKDRLTEEFIKEFLKNFEQRHGAFNELPADQLQEKLSLAEEELNSCSILLGHRFNPMVKDFIKCQFQKQLNAKYGIIVVAPEDDITMANKYRACFNAFIRDQTAVHFEASNRQVIRNLELRDYFTLMFYSMATMKRQQGDNCLCLLIVGASTTGKTLLFEGPIAQVSHSYTNESGVGRFNCNGKSILLLHDIPMSVLTKSRDVEKLKAIARTELVNAKVHSHTVAVSPIFILGTSNQLLYDHSFKFFGRLFSNVQNSYRSDTVTTKLVKQADINAVQARYLEMMVRKRPELPAYSLPRSGTFKREHLIVGLFPDIMDLLFKYQRHQFGSEYAYLYPLFALCKNLHMTSVEEQADYKPKILDLMVQYELTDNQAEQCARYLSV